MILVLAIFILPALVISWVVPSAQISLTAGVMQAFSAFFAHFGLTWLVPLTAIAMVVAMLSGMMAWLAGPSKGLLKIGQEQGYLPPYFQKVNAEGIQMHILVVQGIVISIIGLLYAFIPSVSSAYWIFSVMTTQVYLIMYVLMFVAAVKLRRNQPDHPRGYKAPGAGDVVRRRRARLGARVPDRVRAAVAVLAFEPARLRAADPRRHPGARGAAAAAALPPAQAVLEDAAVQLARMARRAGADGRRSTAEAAATKPPAGGYCLGRQRPLPAPLPRRRRGPPPQHRAATHGRRSAIATLRWRSSGSSLIVACSLAGCSIFKQGKDNHASRRPKPTRSSHLFAGPPPDRAGRSQDADRCARQHRRPGVRQPQRRTDQGASGPAAHQRRRDGRVAPDPRRPAASSPARSW